MKKITVINNYDSFVFNLVRYLEELGCLVNIQRNDELNFNEIKKTEAILLSPGPGIPSESGQLMEVISHFKKTKKFLGVCLGHQAIAEHFGGKIALAPIAIHGKESSIQIDKTSLLFSELPKSIQVGRYHSWHVNELPKNFRTTAETVTGEIMAIEHLSLPIFGIQFHPESILTPDGRKIIYKWLNL
jgi:anthranilate synthase component 2